MDDEPGRGNGGWDRLDWNGMHDGLGWAGWLLMALFLMLLVALVIGIVVLLLARSTGRGGMTSGAGTAPHATGPSGAEQVLGERYARGEIDEDEYLRRRSVLRG
jgi:putative membrane protein